MTTKQTDELKDVFGKLRGVGNLDYVAGWYGKAAQFINQSKIKCAFVSTNSITQGQQVPILWKYLMEEHNMIINFAYHTFDWNSEAKDHAAVHCVIIGFSQVNNKDKKIYVSDEQIDLANNINGYLLDAPNVFIENRRSTLGEVPKMVFGSMPNDGGHLILTQEERDELLKSYPQSKQVIKRFIGAREYINNIQRYCLWIEPENLNLISKIKPIMDRLEKVKEHRSNSKRKSTQELANKPYAFGEIRQPNSDYLIVPAVSSENRRYIPIGYLNKNVITSNAALIIPGAKLYHFAILSSNVHMSWMRAVAGRLESRYRYSASIVYNNFPWISLTDTHRKQLNETANEILKARAKYPKMSMADLYNELIMPPELRKAHQDNDRLVMEIYGMDVGTTKESDAVEKLFEMYNEMTK